MADINSIRNIIEKSRITHIFQITSLTSDFNNGGIPFAIFLRPKNTAYNTSELIDMQLVKDDTNSLIPVLTNQWNVYIVSVIKANAGILSNYDIYIGAGI